MAIQQFKIVGYCQKSSFYLGCSPRAKREDSIREKRVSPHELLRKLFSGVAIATAAATVSAGQFNFVSTTNGLGGGAYQLVDTLDILMPFFLSELPIPLVHI